MSTLLKKIILSLVTSIYLLASSLAFFPSPSLAQDSTWYKQDFTDWYSKVYDTSNASEIYGERYTAAQVEWVVYGLFAFILNHVSDQGTSVKCIGGDAQACATAITESIQKIQDLMPQSYLQENNDSLASMVFAERSFSGIGYIKEKVQNLRLIPEAKAQSSGFGFGALDPIKNLWSASRNSAYGLIVIATLVLAFMIMFRVKISPQVIISAQSAIPKVVGALIFVTFSYAIAGFLIDLMYIVIGIISLILGQVMGSPTKIFDMMTNGAPIVGGGFLGLMLMYCVVFFWVLLFTLFASGSIILNTTAFAGTLILFFILAIIIVAIIMIFMFFKILWLLLKTVAQTYLLVIVGPLQIMLGAITQQMGIGSWIRSLVANLAVYPVVGTLFALSFLFLFYAMFLGLGNIIDQSILQNLVTMVLGSFGIKIPTATWSPPLTLGESYIPLIFTGVSFVLLTLIPKAAEIIQGFISGKPFAYGSAIGEAFGPVKSGVRLGLGYWGGRETEIGQEELRSALSGGPGSEDAAKRRIQRGELLKTVSSTPFLRQ
ncbi:MAG: hypothetical protein AAB535_04330 [Patescibacteria group bacterium]